MARTTAPLFSLDASGSLANAIVFSKWRGRQFVRRHTIPKNPRTAAQMGVRAMMKFLSQSYAANKTDIDTNFATPAANANVSPFNSYVAYNMSRWRQMKGPSIVYPATDVTTAITITMSLTGGQRNILVSVDASGVSSNFGIMIFRSLAEIVDVNWNNCIALVSDTSGTVKLYTDAPLDAAEYHYRAASFNSVGDIGTACADDTASAT
jgi:hypothetical protein